MASKIPDTIRKAALWQQAEKSAVSFMDTHPGEWGCSVSVENSNQALRNARLTAYIDGYLACYEKLMSGGASGYAAVNRDNDFMLATVAYDNFHAAAILHDQLDASGEDFDENGWSVVPVKIIKIAEEPKP